MRSPVKQAMAAIAMAMVIALPAKADEQMPPERTGGDMALDLLLARPIGLLAIVGGSVAFVVSLPFTIPSGSMDSAADAMVKQPINYTFKRPLGQIDVR